MVTDLSDSGTNPDDPNPDAPGDNGTSDDPTPLHIADLAIAKSIVGEPFLTDLGNFVVTYQLVVENTGTVDLGSLSLLEDLTTQFGPAFVDAGNLTLVNSPADPDSNIVVDSAVWNGASNIELLDTSNSNILAIGDSFTIQFAVEVDPRVVTEPLVNQVVGEGQAVDQNGIPVTDSMGNPIFASDISDSGTNPNSTNPNAPDDQGTADDPTLYDVPPPVLGTISGVVFQDGNNDGIQDPGEVGIPGVEVTLTGVDVFGNPVQITGFTGPDGSYSFQGLEAGTYAVTQTQPEGFEDGLENGDPSFTIGNDVVSNIQLGFGESFETITFGESLIASGPGTTSGQPANLPPLGPLVLSPISNLVRGFLGAPGPIYSGIPINANADPLTLESGRAVLGGYTPNSNGMQDGCCLQVDECGNPIESQPIFQQPVEQLLEGDCGCDGIPIQGVPAQGVPAGGIPIEGQFMDGSETNEKSILESASDLADEDSTEGSELVETDESQTRRDDALGQNLTKRPSFLERMSNWFKI